MFMKGFKGLLYLRGNTSTFLLHIITVIWIIYEISDLKIRFRGVVIIFHGSLAYNRCLIVFLYLHEPLYCF